ncbi:brix domain-containing protein ZK795.3-like [Schistocerca gregaria]|uniref:brix domain-containing protein ZK795.3-like n=1 Tax=Schistocerca gregaria TaxID=7010 RepID=UPI00211E321B|nr:brix domain-containing protein ZK795.3-like [Schistocerca gregaria]
MIRRNTRLRREYLYRKSLIGLERDQYLKKKAISDALNKGQPLSKDLRKDAASILDEMEYEGDVKEAMNPPTDASDRFPKVSDTSLAMDSEYALAGISDPQVLITTSLKPSSKLLTFAKELKLVIPNSVRINRGNHPLKELVEACRQHQATDLILVHETRGNPDGLIICHMPYGPTCYFSLFNVIQRHDIDNVAPMSLQTPHLIFDQFETKLGQRVTTILKHLFPPAKDDSTRVITFANHNDFISFRHHIWKKSGKDIQLIEVGPRFELQLYHIKLGTLEMKDAESEWVWRPYINTARKTNVL